MREHQPEPKPNLTQPERDTTMVTPNLSDAVICSFSKCGRPVKNKTNQLCATHYKQHLRGESLTRIGQPPTCSIQECESATLHRGMCSKHYTRWQKYGDPYFVTDRSAKRCEVPDCGKKHYGRDLCEGHYTQVIRNGQEPKVLRQELRIEDALLRKVEKTDSCWNWVGNKDSLGYGRLKFQGKTVSAHRASYLIWVEEIPEDLVIDHICHNTSCVNPDHLRAGTQKQNMEHRLTGNLGARSKFQGVSWFNQSKKWRARVTHNGVVHDLGLFTNEKDAAEAARMKRIELYTFNIADRKQ